MVSAKFPDEHVQQVRRNILPRFVSCVRGGGWLGVPALSQDQFAVHAGLRLRAAKHHDHNHAAKLDSNVAWRCNHEHGAGIVDCGPRCWRYVEKLNGRRATLKRLLALCGTTTDGTYVPNMVEAGESLGYICVVRENMTWRQLQSELRRGRHVIAVWWSVINAGEASKPDGHYSVVRAATCDRIWLYDPEAEDVIILPREMWLSHWWSWEHAPSSERKDYIRTAIVARKK